MFLILCLLATASFTHALESYESTDIELFGGGIHLKRLQPALYVTYIVDTIPMSDFQFVMAYADERLQMYFNGMNIGYRKVPQTTPLYLLLDILDLSVHPKAAYLIPKATRKAGTPPPMPPLQMWNKPETYYFVKPMNSTEFPDILHEAADLLTDLSYNRMPFKDSKVMLAFYQFPAQEEAVTKPNEIWVEREIKVPDYFAQ